MKDHSGFRCLFLHFKEIWKVAEAFRVNYWPEGTLPINIEKIVEMRLGLSIEPVQSLYQELDIDAYLRTDLKGIVVDHTHFLDERFGNRIRFSFAHEIGHLILHKEIYPNISSPEEWKLFNGNLPINEYKAFEFQANEFAGRLLVPVDRLTIELENCIELLHSNGLGHLIKEEASAVIPYISPMISKAFGVSSQVVEKRLERERLWPPNI